MPLFDVPADIPVPDFFTEHVPPFFAARIAGQSARSLVGKEFTLQYNVGDHRYCLRIADGTRLEVVAGGVDRPTVALTMTEALWRESVAGKIDGVLDRFVDPTQLLDPGRFAKLSKARGTVVARLKDGADVREIRLTHNGAAEPAVEITLKQADWVKMLAGKKSGHMLFLTGKLRAKGDLGFLVQVQALL